MSYLYLMHNPNTDDLMIDEQIGPEDTTESPDWRYVDVTHATDAPSVDKRQEGDQKTPEGLYSLDWRNPGSGYYKSIHVSYPAPADVSAAAASGVDPGGMIMIHGQPNYFGWLAFLTQRFDWTNGCIAVTNAEMEEIWAMVPNNTPIEIKP